MKTTYPSEAAPDCNYWFNYIYSLLNHPDATKYIQNRDANKSIGEENGTGKNGKPICIKKQNRAVTKKAS